MRPNYVSKDANHYRFNSQHDWNYLYYPLTSTWIFTLITNKIFTWATKLRDKQLWTSFEFANHLALMTCFISYKKWVHGRKYPNNTHLYLTHNPHNLVYWLRKEPHRPSSNPKEITSNLVIQWRIAKELRRKNPQ